MKVKRQSTGKDGACSFCDKGKLGADEKSLVYPYREVTYVEGRSVIIKICDNCLETLNQKADEVNLEKYDIKYDIAAEIANGLDKGFDIVTIAEDIKILLGIER